MAPTSEDTWEVIGGASTGGIIVRSGKDKQSPECPARLATGSKIHIIDANASRVCYELISGEGPQKGWVNTKFQGRDLIAKLEMESHEKALEEYGKRFGEQPSTKQSPGYHPKAYSWSEGNQIYLSAQTSKPTLGDQHLQERLENELGPQIVQSNEEKKAPLPKLSATATKSKLPVPCSQSKAWVQDEDGDDVRICLHCNLPLGELSYNRRGNCVHGECMAQLMVQDLRSEENARIQIEKAGKEKQHAEYGIGWRPDHIPRNDEAASKLAMRDVPQGMVCLVLDESTGSILVGATTEPVAAVNLEYLSTALLVRRIEGHEPVFSLNPVDASDKSTMHEKVFVPEWLAGTSAGEVLFQSDYHLKELSMGEYDQAVVGMKSGFDHTEIDGTYGWNAREWFLVRKAEVQMADGNILIPMVKMGVEAREQVVNGNCLQDKAITYPGHPMVKYASDFTRNFDLIAERKSVVFHLRELAKASVMAKFLLDSGINLDESWFLLAASKEDVCSLQVPQLWNERIHSSVHVQDGTIQRGNSMETTNGVYGGVQFGLDKFNLSSPMPAAGIAALSTARMPTARIAALSAISPADRPAAQLALSIGQPVAGVAGAVPPRPPLRAEAFQLATTLQSSAVGPMRMATTQKMAFGLSRAAQVAPISSLITPTPSIQVKQPTTVPPGWEEDAIAPPGVTPAAPKIAAPPRLSALPVGVTMMPRAGLTALAGPRLDGVNIGAARGVGAPVVSVAGVPAAGVAPGMPPLQGVDLRLDQFDLSDPKRVSLEVQAGTWKSLDECVAVGSSFFDALDGTKQVFKEVDQALLQKVFHPMLSDRRAEGAIFVPPDASHSYVEHLRTLVKEEDTVREYREQAFFSEDFQTSEPGYIFPHSWTPCFEVANREEGRPQGSLIPRPEYVNQPTLLDHLKTSAPVFDKAAEDGHRFRIYRIGNLEVRTTQDNDGKEVIGAVFSIQTPKALDSSTDMIDEREQFAKVMEYVEHGDPVSGADGKGRGRRYYLVLETEGGNRIVTERMRDGRLSWVFNPADLDDRSSLAKLTRSETCVASVSIRDMMSCRAKLAEGNTLSSKRFIHAMFIRAVGRSRGAQPSNREFMKA